MNLSFHSSKNMFSLRSMRLERPKGSGREENDSKALSHLRAAEGAVIRLYLWLNKIY